MESMASEAILNSALNRLCRYKMETGKLQCFKGLIWRTTTSEMAVLNNQEGKLGWLGLPCHFYDEKESREYQELDCRKEVLF
jgi:hypothetical protein